MPASTAEGRKCGTLGGVEPEGVEELTRRARLVKLGDHTLSPQQQEIRVLGAPIKSAEYVQSQLEQKTVEREEHCGDTPAHVQNFTERHLLCGSVFSIEGGKLARMLSNLPLSRGGLGISCGARSTEEAHWKGINQNMAP